jgi:hypothetical protein
MIIPGQTRQVVAAIPLGLTGEERRLSGAFQVFRKSVRAVIAGRGRNEQLAGAFAVEVLGKRLLSCPVTFADSWHRYLRGLEETEGASAEEVRAAERAAREDLPDDLEAESRTGHAAQTVGAWLKPLRQAVERDMAAVDGALAELGLGDQSVASIEVDPVQDSRFEALTNWIDRHLRTHDGRWRDDERLIVFTEYKTTLDYLRRRLRSRYSGPGAVRVLYGGMDDPAEGDREGIIAAFNDPGDPVRVLVSTDAASEGLNLQETARYLLHYDVPWNPARLEQRNGRLDRHGRLGMWSCTISPRTTMPTWPSSATWSGRSRRCERIWDRSASCSTRPSSGVSSKTNRWRSFGAIWIARQRARGAGPRSLGIGRSLQRIGPTMAPICRTSPPSWTSTLEASGARSRSRSESGPDARDSWARTTAVVSAFDILSPPNGKTSSTRR